MQKNLRRPVYAVAALAAGAAVALTGCSSTNDTADKATSAVASAADQATSAVASATSQAQAAVEGLDNATAQQIFRAAVDPNTPADQLGRYVDVEGDALDGLANFNKGAAQGGYTPEVYTVKSVAADGADKATVTVSVASPHAPAPVDMPFEFVNKNGSWLLSSDAVTALMSQGSAHAGAH
ncbi:MAG: DUF4878 domain-containing protein [Gordonia sp. (in: high G+C Gram-positive bacteria)]|uniref:DUF4878 domain-containing protein n=1 Tax=Gordonia sp. (in: high G+C Gram-positive bacteria) TaxID=84139 RepID=UPI0039E69E67